MDPEIFNKIRIGLIFYILLVGSVCVHEWAHAFVGDKLGDRLPRSMGRVTLNPIAHMDILGTVVLPLIMIFGSLLGVLGSELMLIGWGKPVIISLPNPQKRVRDDLLITAAGPLSNLVICLLCAIGGGIVIKTFPQMLQVFSWGILLNAVLFLFNLLPIPPLDGAHFLKHAMKMSEETYMNFSRWGFLILLVLINIPLLKHGLGVAIYGIADQFTRIMFWIAA